jgi:hypothetical protein
MSDKKLERRHIKLDKLEVRAAAEGAPAKIIGHAAVFNSAAEINSNFREQILPGAFADSIGEDDVRALFNHDPNYVLGRNTAGTLRMSEDDVGLAIEVDPPDTQWARDLMVSITRGDISQMSFGFNALEETWDYAEDGSATRTLKKVKLFDVSPVTYPAYDDTDVAVRSLNEFRAAHPPTPRPDDIGLAQTLRARVDLESIS